jgi:hypothetical protein
MWGRGVVAVAACEGLEKSSNGHPVVTYLPYMLLLRRREILLLPGRTGIMHDTTLAFEVPIIGRAHNL